MPSPKHFIILTDFSNHPHSSEFATDELVNLLIQDKSAEKCGIYPVLQHRFFSNTALAISFLHDLYQEAHLSFAPINSYQQIVVLKPALETHAGQRSL